MVRRWYATALRAPIVVLAFALPGCAGVDVAPASSSPTTTNAPATGTTPTADSSTSTGLDTTPDRLRVQIVAETPHDPTVFTQGLELDGDRLYESSGGYGESFARVTDRDTGMVVAETEFADRIFAEGLTLSNGRLIVLSWQERTAFVLDPQTLAELDRFVYEGEGWGLCDLGDRLVMSDGGDTLRIRSPDTFALVREVPVRLEGAPVDQINELECVNGEVYANLWKTDTIVRIDPDTGEVTAVIDASALRPESTKSDADAVLNGIAYVADTDSFLLRGKRWPMLYEVRFVS